LIVLPFALVSPAKTAPRSSVTRCIYAFLFEKPPIGSPFRKGDRIGAIQIGVNPATLTPGKNLRTLDSGRLRQAVMHAGDHAIEVTTDGLVRNGNHRLKDALKRGKTIDIRIVP
jgi:hypothetical protein